MYFLHTVERGQTVFSISRMYNVSPDTIYRLNPESESGIRAGSRLKIPQESGSYFYHTIQPKETLYSVSRMYQMKGEDILDVNPGLSIETFTVGRIIRIPTNRVTTPMEGDEDDNRKATNSLLNPSGKEKREMQPVKVALLLPFGLKEGTSPQNAGNNRIVEYYEGFLLALKELKKQGISVDLQVYDTGSGVDLLPELLEKASMQDVHLIIGGLSDKQIKLIATFSSERGIPYVIPFTSKTDEPLNHHTVYQISTPQSYLLSKASAAFYEKYRHANIIFYVPESSKNKMDFIEVVQKDLDTKGVPYQVVKEENLFYEIQVALSPTQNNVFIPSDDTLETLSVLTSALKSVMETSPQTEISLFGYPAWQIYSPKYTSDFFLLNVTFYSIFYANPTSPKVKSFHNRFIQWYSREMINTYPKYGMLGYDTGVFFVQLLDKYGTAAGVNVNKPDYASVQTDFHFERVNNWGGFINTNIYMVEFKPDLTITSTRY
ncbi:MAG: LysM peptidoglycan-binding domain-containing protein [Dysgonamonadaceae bacterium]|nr:LysM peptidoglycan-binding domain-containing protein [Dysgonamonadaceae bacterium]